MIRVVTHSGSFHADDVFAVAALSLHLGTANMEVVRTRDPALIAAGDWVVDVGREFDPKRQRFDHHQPNAPVRENGMPYAAFGLIWQELGEVLAGSREAAEEIERQLVIPVDANDVGVDLFESKQEFVPFEIHDLVGLFNPVWGGNEENEVQFKRAVTLAETVILRIIEKTKGRIAMRSYIAEVVAKNTDNEVLIFERPVSAAALIEYSEAKVLVQPDDPATNNNWSAECIRKGADSFEPRVLFPAEWAGLEGKALIEASGIQDAVFCHKARYFFVAKSKESALKAARMIV